MTTFDDRKRGEETKYKHDLELSFKIRNRRNKLFGLWVAETHLGLTGEEAAAYAKDVVMADFELPGDADIFVKVSKDLDGAGKPMSDDVLEKQLHSLEEEARRQVMAQ